MRGATPWSVDRCGAKITPNVGCGIPLGVGRVLDKTLSSGTRKHKTPLLSYLHDRNVVVGRTNSRDYGSGSRPNANIRSGDSNSHVTWVYEDDVDWVPRGYPGVPENRCFGCASSSIGTKHWIRGVLVENIGCRAWRWKIAPHMESSPNKLRG